MGVFKYPVLLINLDSFIPLWSGLGAILKKKFSPIFVVSAGIRGMKDSLTRCRGVKVGFGYCRTGKRGYFCIRFRG